VPYYLVNRFESPAEFRVIFAQSCKTKNGEQDVSDASTDWLDACSLKNIFDRSDESWLVLLKLKHEVEMFIRKKKR